MAITVKHTKVSTVPDSADTSLVRPSDWNDTHTLTGFGTAAELNAGVANGVATLDSSGKVPTSQIPLQGDLNYQGTWNASTNTPTLTSSVGTKGYYYVVDVAGTTNLNGITDWQIGDWAIYNGTVWQKVDNTDAVTSVNGYTGTVVLTQTDIAGTANAPTNTNITSMTGITGGISSPDYIAFDTTYATPLTAGQLGWDGNNTLAIGMAGGKVTQHIGEDLYFYYKATAAVTKGQVVMFTGAVGASGVPTGAPATGITDGSYIMGIAAESVALNGFGLVQSFGELKNINTSGYADGDILWYNPSVTGGLTKTKPSAPNVKVQMAAVIYGGSSGAGSILIRINSGSTLGGTDSNAQITSPTNSQIITYDGTNAYWKNTSLTAGTAISVTPSSTGVITVANTAPDQVVSLTGAGTTTISGAYPSFTITSNDAYTGTVTAVTGTAPIASTGGTTPAISIPKATTSVDGYLSATDWTTFNNKQPAGAYLTTVTADAPLTGLGTSASHLSIPAASGTVNGYLTSTDWTTFNNKTSNLGTVTSVGGTGTVNGITLTGTVTTSGNLTLGGTLGGIANSQLTNSAITINGTSTSLGGSINVGTVTSVSALTLGTTGTDLSSTVANGTTTPVITLNVPTASATNRGVLSTTDWTTFNSKAPGVTFTTNYVPYGQGTTTLNQSASYTFDGTTQTAPIQRASNGIIVNSKTVSASYSIASGDSAMSVGPVTVATGQTVTIASGSRWVVL